MSVCLTTSECVTVDVKYLRDCPYYCIVAPSPANVTQVVAATDVLVTAGRYSTTCS